MALEWKLAFPHHEALLLNQQLLIHVKLVPGRKEASPHDCGIEATAVFKRYTNAVFKTCR